MDPKPLPMAAAGWSVFLLLGGSLPRGKRRVEKKLSAFVDSIGVAWPGCFEGWWSLPSLTPLPAAVVQF